MQEVIVKYSGDIGALGFQTEILNENYAIVTLPEEEIPSLRTFPEIEYVEMPKKISPTLMEAAESACIAPVQSVESYGLTGEGILIAIIDSGIDYTHPDFKGRILFIWDQTVEGAPPTGFIYGTEYNAEEIAGGNIPHADNLGHGTAVAGIAAGSDGVAPKASIIAVKLGERDGFARTTEIMRAVKYTYDKARALNMPLVINLSYGTNDGSHEGYSLFERYLSDMGDKWKNVVVVASGNEGGAKHHYRYKLEQGETVSAPFSIATRLRELSVHIWKSFTDSLVCEMISPSGVSTGEFSHTFVPKVVHLDGVLFTFNYTQPNHYNQNNSVNILLKAREDRAEISQGVWTIKVRGIDIVEGTFDIWLPTIEEVSDKTVFLTPNLETTLTIPSSADNVIAVGGYDSSVNTIAVFSGRGYTRGNGNVKPDICAPAVHIKSCRVGGGYGNFTGTSAAAPFVTGSAALMMQWGIIKGNDPYLYGQRIKAFLRKGAAREPTVTYPNTMWGYGRLCLKTTMDYLYEYSL